ncbi:hypothetical protein PCANC_02406 [Puccinia coronata f. sp. avenae]|uniref:Uncharacterized protein n=1 Tax=Puccinia coronata f. sp. avenae TaxID=200324 RepID=A0A2N5T915_9BASI|nr:hypothetical protein PCANC_04368 [Puccinia coronata f. sp. avenae]PLW57262.1 hypothetical protein PCANC_02406 [Puccinia coronata f. sp. avenae]
MVSQRRPFRRIDPKPDEDKQSVMDAEFMGKLRGQTLCIASSSIAAGSLQFLYTHPILAKPNRIHPPPNIPQSFFPQPPDPATTFSSNSLTIHDSVYSKSSP